MEWIFNKHEPEIRSILQSGVVFSLCKVCRPNFPVRRVEAEASTYKGVPRLEPGNKKKIRRPIRCRQQKFFNFIIFFLDKITFVNYCYHER